MPTDLILIGPPRAGKSTLGALLAERLGLPHIELDELRWGYYREIGYDDGLAKTIRNTGGFVALVYYWKQLDAYAVERLLASRRDCVFSFGAGHSVYDSQEDFARLQAALTPYPNVILVLPSPDPDESIRILDERTRDLAFSYGQGFNWNEYFVRHPANTALAKQIVYTQGKTPQESCTGILDLLIRP